jgi:hypothetical protein
LVPCASSPVVSFLLSVRVQIQRGVANPLHFPVPQPFCLYREASLGRYGHNKEKYVCVEGHVWYTQINCCCLFSSTCETSCDMTSSVLTRGYKPQPRRPGGRFTDGRQKPSSEAEADSDTSQALRRAPRASIILRPFPTHRSKTTPSEVGWPHGDRWRATTRPQKFERARATRISFLVVSVIIKCRIFQRCFRSERECRPHARSCASRNFLEQPPLHVSSQLLWAEKKRIPDLTSICTAGAA